VAESGNVLTGVGTTSGATDVLGADGAAAGGAVVGVVLGTSGNPVSGGVGAAIAGAFGALTLNADGSYSYVHTGTAGGGTDTYTYAIKDADGSLSTATLTIAVADSSPGGISIPGAGGADTQVLEAGLGPRGGEPAGSNPAAPTTAVGTITFTSVDGVKEIEVGGLVLTASGALKTFTDATGSSPMPGFVRTACEIALLIENHSARTSVPTVATSERTAAIRRNCIQLPRTNHGSPTSLEKLRKRLSTS
jgi:VCBS repeat-containing protein